MLNLCELNGYLYQHLDREAKKKEMVRNYGSYLMHSENNSAKPNIAEQANSWLAHFAEMINDEKSELNKSAESAKAVAEVMIPECSKILRKVNAQKAGKELAKKLVDARKNLEDIYQAAMAHSAIEKQEHIEHGEKWRKHKYIDIRNGRYIYPDDLKKSGESNTYIKNLAKKNQEAFDARDAYQANPNKENFKNWNQSLKDFDKTKKSMALMADVTKQEKANKEAKEKQQQENYRKNKEAAAHEGDRYSKENIQKQQEANTKAANEYQNEKQKAVGGSRDVSISAQEKAKKDSEYNSKLKSLIPELLKEVDEEREKYSQYKATDSGWEAAHSYYLKRYNEIAKKLDQLHYDIYGTWLSYDPREDLQKYEDQRKSAKHSAFSISDDEMSAFLAKRGKSITT